MKQLFLTSSVHAVASNIASRLDLSLENTLVFIDTAAEVEEGSKQWLKDDRQALVDAGFVVTDYTITGKHTSQLEADLAKFSYIYVSGGNTFYLLQESQKSGFIDVVCDLVLRQNKTYIGTSAGSIIAGPDIYPTYRIDNLSKAPDLTGYIGYGLVDFCLMPHWGSEYFKDLYLNNRLEHTYTEDQIPLLLLTDNHYVHVLNETLQIIDVRNPA